MTGELLIGKDVKGSGRGLILRYYPGICLEGLSKTTIFLSQDSRSPERDLNLEPRKSEAGVLLTQPQLLV
jgi:hypothetical protein